LTRSLLLLVLVGLLAGGFWLYSLYSPNQPADSPADERSELLGWAAAGQKALAEGNYQAAQEAFENLQRLRVRQPDLVSAAEDRRLVQLARQADLLADLLTESLQEILGRLDGLDEREGQALFVRRYHKKAVVFFAEVRRDAAGTYHLNYRLATPRAAARLELHDLKLLQSAPLEDPRLLLFGVRLASVHRDAADAWIVTPEPESGVFLTDPGAARSCCFGAPDMEQLQEVLARQNEWVVARP
jgi:hypothetical protein